jgi:hypothetical protein
MREPPSGLRYFPSDIHLQCASNLYYLLDMESKSKLRRRSGCPVSLSLERFARGPLPPYRKRRGPCSGTSRNADLGRTPRRRQRLLRRDQLSRNKSSLHSQRSSQAMARPRYYPNFADLQRQRIRPQFRKEKIMSRVRVPVRTS